MLILFSSVFFDNCLYIVDLVSIDLSLLINSGVQFYQPFLSIMVGWGFMGGTVWIAGSLVRGYDFYYN